MIGLNLTPPVTAWKSYEYFIGGHRYHLPQFDMTGGPDGIHCLWCDDSMWSIDTPENPHSILFLVHYPIWNDCPPRDIRNAEIRCRFYGKTLDLFGASCHFWAVTQLPRTTRWHYTGNPLPISPDGWGASILLRLEKDPAYWHCSFASDPACAADLDHTLSLCTSYGFAFVGFSEKVTGKIGFADFSISNQGSSQWPYIYTAEEGNLSAWMTVSRRRKSVVSLDEMKGDFPEISPDNLMIHDDYLVFTRPVSFAYLAFLHADSVGRRDLRNALLMVRQNATSFKPGGGKICFFVEHSASGTRWLLKIFFNPDDTGLYYEMLTPNSAFWVRMSGEFSLDEVLAGQMSLRGYDYLGFILIEPSSEPSGNWELVRFSIGPTLDASWAGG